MREVLQHLARDGTLTATGQGVYWKPEAGRPSERPWEQQLDAQMRAHIAALEPGTVFGVSAFTHLEAPERVHRSLASLAERHELRRVRTGLYTRPKPRTARLDMAERIRQLILQDARDGPFTASDFSHLGLKRAALYQPLQDLAREGALTATVSGVYWKAGAEQARTRLTQAELDDAIRAHVTSLPPGTVFGLDAFSHLALPRRVSSSVTYLKNTGELRRLARNEYARI